VTTQRVRAIIALTTVSVFMGITAFMALFPLISKANVQLSEYADFFVKIASIYTGILGVIIGYYFGRAHDTPLGGSNRDQGGPPRPQTGGVPDK
jgi:hypothetical protein